MQQTLNQSINQSISGQCDKRSINQSIDEAFSLVLDEKVLDEKCSKLSSWMMSGVCDVQCRSLVPPERRVRKKDAVNGWKCAVEEMKNMRPHTNAVGGGGDLRCLPVRRGCWFEFDFPARRHRPNKKQGHYWMLTFKVCINNRDNWSAAIINNDKQ